ncbi:MAG: hypothetical protein PHH40_00745 [Candidatus Moranbacteria bacterium]|nr:hypothetical protein [Candidatus Moranbacteria bacterium]MDD3964841.1 hypothetical protein [Candidatus Moranbacteria bacterium]
MENLFFLIGGSFLIISIFWLLKILKSFFWIKNSAVNNIIFNSVDNNIRFFILIPVLDETAILEDTVKYFLKISRVFKGSKIIIITTEKEYRFNHSGSKNDTVALSKSLEGQFKDVVHVHYPDVDGKMAHQVNYAVNFVKNNLDKKDFFALYNADSRPDIRTFSWINNFQLNKRHGNSSEVFQQYGNYLGNYLKIVSMPNFFEKAILVSASLWQNRWSIGFEIPHSLNQLKKRERGNFFSFPMNYCIGHGLFFSCRIYDKVRGFSENMHNEDAIFGLKLSYYQDTIVPIPFFDEAFSPESVKSLFFQKVNWFFGPLQSFEYYSQIIKDDHSVRKSRLLVLTLKLFSHAVYWIFGPLMMMFLFIYALLSETAAIWLFFNLTFISFFIIPNFFSWLITRNRIIASEIPAIIFYLFVGSLFFYALHGLAGCLSLWRYLGHIMFGQPLIQKNKTALYK